MRGQTAGRVLEWRVWIGLVVVLVSTGDGIRGDGPPSTRPVVGPATAEYHARRVALMTEVRAAEGSAAPVHAVTARADGDARPAPAVVIVVVGKGEPGDDARFHQENDFYYLTGIDVPYAAAILRPETSEETLYLPPGNKMRERFEGPTLTPGPDAAGRTGFARVASSAEFVADLFRALADPGAGRGAGSVVYLIDTEPTEATATRSAWLTRLIHMGAPNVRVKELASKVHEQRKTKSPAEVDLLRQAIAATAEAQTAVAHLARPGRNEAMLEGAILNEFRTHGAVRAGFPSIVGSGLNSTVLHYGRNDRTMTSGDLVVVDIGGEVAGYTADITRTYPVSGKYTPRQREVYQLVLDAQTGAAHEFQTGKSTIDSLNRWVRTFFRASPLRAKDEDGTEQTMDHFFLHGLGHHLGLDVHDVGDASKPLEPGQVFTIEPGLYIASEGFGVRIEDDYLVTATGVEKLSGSIPCTVEDVERAMARPATGPGVPRGNAEAIR